jgi:hypothetical protein
VPPQCGGWNHPKTTTSSGTVSASSWMVVRTRVPTRRRQPAPRRLEFRACCPIRAMLISPSCGRGVCLPCGSLAELGEPIRVTDESMTVEEFTQEIGRFRRVLARWSNGRNARRDDAWYLNASNVALSAVELEARGLDAESLWPVLSAMWSNRAMTDGERAEHEALRQQAR